MLHRLTLLLALTTLAPAAMAAPAEDPPPWLGGPEIAWDDDAVADAPLEEGTADTSEDAVETLDLQVLKDTLEDGVRRVVVKGRDPAEALPLDLAEAPETTTAELRGLLTGAGARQVRLHGVEVMLVLWKDQVAVHASRGTLLPDARSVLLALGPAELPTEPVASPLPGGLGKTWTAAEARMTETIRDARCASLPMATDEVLAVVVPPQYLDQARTQRDAAVKARFALCKAAAEQTWDRMELRLGALHFNLFDNAGTLRGGLRLQVDPAAGNFAYPMFKKLGP